MRSYETRKAVLLKTYLASDIKVPILSFMRIVYDVYDLVAFSCFLVLWSCSFTLFLYLCSCKRDIYHSNKDKIKLIIMNNIIGRPNSLGP